MQRIEIKKLLGTAIVTREHGAKLRDLVAASWRDAPIEVDFGGLQVTSVSFFDEAFGQLTLKHGAEELFRKVSFRGLDKFDQALLRDIVASRSREAKKRAGRENNGSRRG